MDIYFSNVSQAISKSPALYFNEGHDTKEPLNYYLTL